MMAVNQQEHEHMRADLQRLGRNIGRIANRPAQVIRPPQQQQQEAEGATGGGGEEGAGNQRARPAFHSTLSNAPRTINDLWVEYEFGLGGRKAAKEFTPRERGAVKYKYHRRKVVWDTVARLIRSGHTADTACDRIYDVYRHNKTVTQIINLMRTDRRLMGGHPMLRV